MHDAASVWLEDVSTSFFRICLTELKNFAGVHDDISVVNYIKAIWTLFLFYIHVEAGKELSMWKFRNSP